MNDLCLNEQLLHGKHKARRGQCVKLLTDAAEVVAGRLLNPSFLKSSIDFLLVSRGRAFLSQVRPYFHCQTTQID